MTIGRMRKQFDRFLKKVHDRVPAEILDEALDLRLTLALRNPEDTGRSEASWNVAIDKPNTTVKPEDWYDPGPPSELAGEVDFDEYALGRSIHITNVIDYIVYLENGWSRQAPQGFIAPSVVEFGALLRQRLSNLMATK